MRKILTGFVALTIALVLTGCACNDMTGMSTPSPSQKASASPLATTTMPQTSPDASMNPGMSTSPDAASSPDASTSPGGGTATIPNFSEGKQVEASEAPKVKEAIEKQYAGAEIVTIKHAMQANQQVYAVTYKVAGSEKTVYVTPDGTLVEGASTTPSSGN